MPLEYLRLTPEIGDRHEINKFLRTDDWRSGTEMFANTTYLFFDPSDQERIVGYVTVAMDVVRLSAGERERLGRTNFPDFGALRVVMIGVDSHFKKQGYGTELLMWVVGRGALSVEVAFRFLLADVNLKRKAWYDERLFQVNNAQIYKAGEPGRSTVSVRRDLGYTLNVPAEFGATADARVASVAAGRIGVPSAPQRGGATICPP